MKKPAFKADLMTPEKPLKLEDIMNSVNLAEDLPESYLTTLGSTVVQGYETDLDTRSQWEERNATALEMALQIVKEKSFPWTNASNVKMPLLTIALMQFISRISLLTSGDSIVRCEVRGTVQDPFITDAAERISNHISYQLTDVDKAWQDQDELTKAVAALMGSAFKKTYFDDVDRMVKSRLVAPSNFVVDYKTVDIESCPRISEVISVTASQIKANIYAGRYSDVALTKIEAGEDGNNRLKQTANDRQGLSDQGNYGTGFYGLIEQYISLDLDGDGIAEPYIITVDRSSRVVLRVVANFFEEDITRKYDAEMQKLQFQLDNLPKDSDASQHQHLSNLIWQYKTNPSNHILQIRPQQYFTKFTFMPSPDCGFYGLGLGSLVGPINAAVNAGVNQLLDAGTMANTAGGFLGRGIRVKAGTTAFAPNEWKVVDSTGDDLRKGIVPLPVREPSMVMFQLLSMLMEYGERIVGSTDIMTGMSPGQNTPAETSRNVIEQGMKVFSNIYQRMYRSQREEFIKIFNLNKLFLPQMKDFFEITQGSTMIVAEQDYNLRAVKITPAADPSAASSSIVQQRAQALVALADSHPGLYAVRNAHVKLVKAMGYKDLEAIIPDPTGKNAIPPVPNPDVELEKARLQLESKKLDADLMLRAAEMQLQAQLDNAKIVELMAKAEKLQAEADGVANGHQIALLQAEIGAHKTHQEGILKSVEMLQKLAEQKFKMESQAKGVTNDKSGSER